MELNRPETVDQPRSFQHPDFAGPMPERRQSPRTILSQLIYFDMGAENGGLVKDIGSGGLGLRLAVPMIPTENISFSLMVDASRLRGAAEIAWMDKTRKSCGLRFTSVTPALRRQPTRWRGSPPATVEATPAIPQETAHASAQPSFTAAPVTRNTFLTDDWMQPEERGSAGRFRAFGGGIVIGLLLAAIAVGAVSYLQSTSVLHTPSTAQGPAAPPAAVAPEASSGRPVPGASPTPPPAAAESLPRRQNPINAPIGGAVRTSHSHEPPPSQPAPSGTVAAHAAEGGKSELDEARGYLGATPRNSRTAATLLWGAVSAGNSTAETLLADLYLRGDGVAKSCEQGRVLLTAAAEKGNADAQHQLSNLLRTGCR